MARNNHIQTTVNLLEDMLKLPGKATVNLRDFLTVELQTNCHWTFVEGVDDEIVKDLVKLQVPHLCHWPTRGRHPTYPQTSGFPFCLPPQREWASTRHCGICQVLRSQ